MSRLDDLQTLITNDLRERPAGVDHSGRKHGEPADMAVPWPLSSLEFFEQWWISGIVGGRNPSHYSESPNLWNPYFRKLTVKGIFFALDLPRPENLLEFLNCWLGIPRVLDLTVTDPYKHDVYQALRLLPVSVTTVDPAEQTETVNHLIFDGKVKKLLALNTDGLGMIRALRQRTELAGKQVLLLGAGGSAVSISVELLRCGCKLWIANRTPVRAEALAELLLRSSSPGSGPAPELRWSAFDGIEAVLPLTDVLINTVSGGCPLTSADVARLPAGAVLAETKYGPKAELAELADDRIYVDGRAMLFGQFAEAAETAHPLLGVSRADHLKAIRFVEEQYRFA